MQSSTYRGPAWYGMLAVAFSLLLVSALLAGLTLAICGLDPTWLHLRSVTGTAKERCVVALHFLHPSPNDFVGNGRPKSRK